MVDIMRLVRKDWELPGRSEPWRAPGWLLLIDRPAGGEPILHQGVPTPHPIPGEGPKTLGGAFNKAFAPRKYGHVWLFQRCGVRHCGYHSDADEPAHMRCVFRMPDKLANVSFKWPVKRLTTASYVLGCFLYRVTGANGTLRIRSCRQRSCVSYGSSVSGMSTPATR